jgi:hypothetical protein
VPAARGARLLAVAALGCLLAASGAGAAPGDTYTAASTPSHVKPGASTSYTVSLKNTNPPGSTRAQRARIAAPPGFSITGAPPQHPTEAVGGCNGSPWTIESAVPTEIIVRRPGNNDTGLCPGATLTVLFSATSAATESTYTWTTQLFAGVADEFDPPAAQPTVVVDGTPPTVSIGQAPSNPSNSRSATFAFTSSDGLGALCKLDGGPFVPCTSPVRYDNLSDGPHTFTVATSDAAGNTDDASYTWTVETGAPTAAVASGPARLTTSRSATFVFAANEPSSFQCQLDGRSFLPCTSPASFQGLADGAHTFVVRPTDSVGNTGAVASYAWRIDATAPQTTLGARPRSRTALLSASFTFSASEQATFQCKLDAGAFAACTSPRTYRRLRRTGHTFQVRSVDAAGNVDPTPAVLRWTIVAVVRTTKATSALLAPRSGAHVTSAPLLAWRRVPRASYYNVQLFRGGTKVLSAWPTRTRLQLRQRWTFLGRTQQLAPGRYRWYVWPRLGRGAKARYGTLLGQSTFTVTRR